MAKTTIEWCDFTFNPWRGCTKVAAGCLNCYAETLSKRNPGTLGEWGPNGTRVVASEAMWREPAKWDEDVETTAETWPDDRPRVFCASLADVFEDWVGQLNNSAGELLYADRRGGWSPNYCDMDGHRLTLNLDDVRGRVFRVIDATPNLDWLILTKRPQNIRRMLPIAHNGRDPSDPCMRRDNLWLGCSISTQADADRDIPELLKCRDLAAKLFVSVEPLIEPVDLSRWIAPKCSMCGHPYASPRTPDGLCSAVDGSSPHGTLCHQDGLDWVIVGGESGSQARRVHLDWVRAIMGQCRGAGVACFVKQLGYRPVHQSAGGDRSIQDYHSMGWSRETPGGRVSYHAGHLHLIDRKGGDPAEWPEDLRVREMPVAKDEQ